MARKPKVNTLTGTSSPVTPTQMRMIDAYLEVASREGVHRTTLQKVAKKAAIPFATAHYHFGNEPEALLEMSLNEISNRARTFTLEQMTRLQKSGRNPIQAYIEATFQWTEDRGLEAKLWLFSYYRAGVSEESSRNQSRTLQLARDRVFSLLCEAVGSGEVRMNRKPTREIAMVIHSLLLAYGIQSIVTHERTEKRRLKQACWDAVADILRH